MHAESTTPKMHESESSGPASRSPDELNFISHKGALFSKVLYVASLNQIFVEEVL